MVRHCPWKMCATPGTCNKPGCVARWPLCHKVNLPRYKAQRRHFMTCDIYGTEINKLNGNTEKVNDVSRTHIPLKALMNDSTVCEMRNAMHVCVQRGTRIEQMRKEIVM